MPIYEYNCDSCHQEMEVIQRADEEPISDCPQCHEPSLRKKTSLSSFQLKGGGWYKDGYNSSKAKTSHKPTLTASAA